MLFSEKTEGAWREEGEGESWSGRRERVKKRTRKESGSEERKERNGIIQHLWMRQTYTDSYPQHPHLHTLTTHTYQ